MSAGGPTAGLLDASGLGEDGFPGGSGFAFEVGLEVLLHVVRASELLGTTSIFTRNCLLRAVDLGVARCMARGCECLRAALGFPVAARVSLESFVGRLSPHHRFLIIRILRKRMSSFSILRSH